MMRVSRKGRKRRQRNFAKSRGKQRKVKEKVALLARGSTTGTTLPRNRPTKGNMAKVGRSKLWEKINAQNFNSSIW
jgi:hypothetical protein